MHPDVNTSFLSPLKRYLGCVQHLTIMKKSTNILWQVFLWIYPLISLDLYLRLKSLCQKGSMCLKLLGITKLFFQSECPSFYSHQHVWAFQCPPSFLEGGILWWHLIVHLICISLSTLEIEYLFHDLIGHLGIFFCEPTDRNKDLWTNCTFGGVLMCWG